MIKEIYLGSFENRADIIDAFEISAETLRGVDILLAWYGQGNYDGSAFVLIDRGGTLYEVNGCHCSCYGLENQWDEEETDCLALRYRMKEGSLGKDSYYDEGVFADELEQALTRWEKRQQK